MDLEPPPFLLPKTGGARGANKTRHALGQPLTACLNGGLPASVRDGRVIQGAAEWNSWQGRAHKSLGSKEGREPEGLEVRTQRAGSPAMAGETLDSFCFLPWSGIQALPCVH